MFTIEEKKKWILKVVTSFYDKAKEDILIGYHFRNIQNFDEHIPRISLFWEYQLLSKDLRPSLLSSQKSQIIDKPFDLFNVHIPLKIKKGELHRWVLLFKKTLDHQAQMNPSMHEMIDLWHRKLEHFEKSFLRFFRL